MSQTKIEWADTVWNPTTGCSKVSAGCQNCYAERMAKRLAGRCGYPKDEPFRVTLHPDRLDAPLRWRKPRRVFVNSMGDLFHPDVKDDWLLAIFVAMGLTYVHTGKMEQIDDVTEVGIYRPKHTFMILTKHPRRMKEFINSLESNKDWETKARHYAHALSTRRGDLFPGNAFFVFAKWVEDGMPGLWLGVTAENQQAADERIPILLQTPAAVRFVSIEPMLGPVDLRRIPGFYFPGCTTHDALNGRLIHHDDGDKATPDEKLDWVIVGGETGPNARPCHPDWVRSLRDQCQEAGVPFFLKQLGEWAEIEADAIPRKGKPMCILLNSDGRSRGIEDAPFAEEIGTVVMCRIGKKLAGRLLDGQTWDEFPRQEVAG